MDKLLTKEEVINQFKAAGISFASWAAQNNFNPQLVQKVLRTDMPCDRGQAHQIAVQLRLKHGTLTDVKKFFPPRHG